MNKSMKSGLHFQAGLSSVKMGGQMVGWHGMFMNIVRDRARRLGKQVEIVQIPGSLFISYIIWNIPTYLSLSFINKYVIVK